MTNRASRVPVTSGEPSRWWLREPAATSPHVVSSLPAEAIVQRASFAPHSLRPAEVMRLQQAVGNRAVSGLLNPGHVQTQVTIGAPGDAYEQEADRVAQKVTQSTPAIQSRPPRENARDDGGGALAPRSLGAGGGHPLPQEARTDVEAALGADFSGVRIHTDDQAARLSRDLHAHAFTAGADVYFAAGAYDPASTAGRRLLAHELTHVVQQSRTPMLGDRVQRKLSFENTQWQLAQTAWASKGGSLGALFVNDSKGSPAPDVVVKSGEDAPAEVILAANLHAFHGVGDWIIDAPQARSVSLSEGASIKTHLSGLVAQDRRASKIVAAADTPGTIVFRFVPGTEFTELLEPTLKTQTTGKPFVHTEKKEGLFAGGGRVFSKDSPLRLLTDSDFVTAVGFVTAIDILMANRDRFLTFNPDNFKVDLTARQLLLVDNVQMSNEFAFATYQSGDYVLTSLKSFADWKTYAWTQQLKGNDYASIAEWIAGAIGDKVLPAVRDEDKPTIRTALTQAKRGLAAGLEQGKWWLGMLVPSNRLNEMLKGVPETARDEVTSSLKRRIGHLMSDYVT